jgi:hypothetical protein
MLDSTHKTSQCCKNERMKAYRPPTMSIIITSEAVLADTANRRQGNAVVEYLLFIKFEICNWINL